MVKKVFQIYLFLFTFQMFNREFVILGRFDLRFLTGVLGVILLLRALKKVIKNKEINLLLKDNYFMLINAFFVLIFLSNMMWLFNGLDIRLTSFLAILLSITYNYIFVLVVYFNLNLTEKDKVITYMNLSFIFLFMSMLLVLFGIDLGRLIGHEFRFVARADALAILPMRIAGFAQDPNFVSILAMMVLFSNLIFNSKSKKYIMALAIIALVLSFSRTILAIATLGFMFYCFEKLFKKEVVTKLCVVTAIGLILAPFVIFLLNEPDVALSTLSTRFSMWTTAIHLFLRSPLFGSGLTGFRSYFLSTPSGWYVQPHNTFLSVLSESGTIVFGLLLLIFWVQFKLNHQFHSLLILMLVAICFSYDVTSHAYMVYIFILIYYLIHPKANHYFNKKDP